MPAHASDTRRRAIALIMLALVAWGIYLAVGATGIFVQRSLFDLRKSFIVVTCMAGFLILWGIVLLCGRRPSSDDSRIPARIWSRAGIASLAFSVIGFATWGSSIAAWKKLPASAVTMIGWSAALLIMGSVIAALVSLSDPQPRRGKLLSFFSLLLFVAATVGFFVRMKPL